LIVLPDVLADGSCSLDFGQLVSRRTECASSMHDQDHLTSNGFAAIFRDAEACVVPVPILCCCGAQGLSNEAGAKRASCPRLK
jgi:hypothetical protein